MPELHGKPFKSQLYAKVRTLQSRSLEHWKEVRRLRNKLLRANLKIEELEAKIKRMQDLARAAVCEGDQSIDDTVNKRYVERLYLTPPEAPPECAA